ncbi:MAG: hypothetical protein AMXMBFR7_40010 [Planctomycetota bacterium]
MSIRVRTDVPSGNAALVEVREDGSCTEIAFTADPHGGPEACWFCFRIELNGARPERLRLLLKHAGNLLGGGHIPHIRPVVRADDAGSGDEGGWRRLEPGAPILAPDGQAHAAWELPAPARTLDVAVCYPYGPQEVAQLVADCGGYWRADNFGVSQNGRALVRLSNDYGSADPQAARKPGAYLLARQHSGETSAGWVLDGVMRRLADLRADDVTVWCVPLTNIDGVVQGDYGKDNFPYDLNRAWGRPPMRHETLALQRDFGRWRGRCVPRLGGDFHAPGLSEHTGIYTFAVKPENLNDVRLRDQTHWLGAFRGALGEYAAPDFLRVARYTSRWETPTATGFFNTFEDMYGVTFEVSYVGYAGGEVFTRARYRDAGRRIADAMLGELRNPAKK